MATSSRQSALFGIQDWKKIYQTYREADFQSYDYETLRKSFIDYLTNYYPETFNDYIESSEFVALLDVIAFMGQALSFRNDLNARENFIDTAERRDSVIKLANLVGYTPKRNIAGQGLLKVVAISTTESVIDINGVNLSGTTVLWNDSANLVWQEQFNAIINAALVNSQRIGRPGNSSLVGDIRTDEYSINILSNTLATVPFSVEVDGARMGFELVSVVGTSADTFKEVPPAPNGQFNIVYRNDKLGFGSSNTGFFCYFKQGSLTNFDFSIAESIENNFQDINIDGINNEDTWMYALNDDNSIGEQWIQVSSVYSNIFAAEQSASKKKFSVYSLVNDQVRYIFGDGVFAEIPVGNFRAYVRSGNGQTYIIDPSEMQGVVVAIPYVNRYNRTETLTLTLNLETTISTAQERESLSEIKQRAPTRYYTQNRMVNGEDYSNFPYTLYNSIVKSKAINRSSIGVSRNLDLSDPTGKYSSTNIFGDDGVLYTEDVNYTTTFSSLNLNTGIQFLSITLSSLLTSPNAIQYYQKYYPRYSGYYSTGPINNNVYWQTASLNEGEITGYFYIITQTVPEIVKTPVPLGNFSGETLRLISAGANLKFTPPAGYHFDINRQLKAGIPNPSIGDSEELWTGVSQVVGDGYNFGRGTLSNGLGPVRFTQYIPTGALLDPTTLGFTDPLPGEAIIPSLDSTLSSAIIEDAIDKLRVEQSFSLVYDNTVVNPENRWSLELVTDPNWFVKFEFNAIDKTYLVTVRGTQYYFGSVSQVKFLFDSEKKVFDPKSGQTISDYINILKTNSTSSLAGILGSDYILNIIGQSILSDGFANDYSIEISTINLNSRSISNPEFFTDIVGNNSLVFFRILNDVESLYKTQIVPPGEIITAYSTEALIESVVYEYVDNTVFFASAESKFFKSNRIYSVDEIIYDLEDVTAEYIFRSGRYSINFQYKHNSSNTSRVDPGTTNIIDLYVVTSSYYSQYQTWLNDTTGVVPEPSRPTISELQQAYSDLNNYKMLSDTIVINSVKFKPLFGQKAEPALRGTIKVIKSNNVSVSDSQIRTSVLSALNSYFTLDKWDFGDTFYMSELTAYLHAQLTGLISSVVLVPTDPSESFGDLYQINSAPNEIFVNGATVNDIVIISALTPQALQR